MTNNHNVTTLSDELHALADDIAPSSSGARDRARRGIARHTRNRRAAVGAAAAVVVIATTAVVAVDRDPSAARRPAGTTSHTGSTPSNVVVTTTAPTTAPPGQPTPGSPVLASVPPFDGPALPSSYSKTFPWGTGPGEVAYSAPGGEGVSGGPVAFSADSAGNIVMLDHSSGRLVQLQDGADTSDPIAVSPAVTAAVFDSRGDVIVATVGNVSAYLPNGVRQSDFGPMSSTPITRLEIVGRLVFSVSDTYQRVALLADDGTQYHPVQSDSDGRQTDPHEVQVNVPNPHAITMSVLGSGTAYEIATSATITRVHAVRALPNGTLVFVVGLEQGTQSPDQPAKYDVVRIDTEGHARYQTVSATAGYLVNGPEFVINDDGLAVMSSTTAGGATVTYYPFN